jgi:hypothetical protein
VEVIVQLLRRLAPPFVWVSRDIVQLKTKEKTTKQDTCQAILETGSGRKLNHNGCTAGNLTYPTMVFYFRIGSQVLWNDLRGIVIKQRH